MKPIKKSIAVRLNYAYKNKEGKYQLLLECRNFKSSPDPLRISILDSDGNTYHVAKSNILKGRVIDITQAGKFNSYFDQLKQRIFLVMDYLSFNGKAKTKINVEEYLYKNFREVYEYFQNVDVTDAEEIQQYSDALNMTKEDWQIQHEERIALEKELNIYKPSQILEAIDFFKFPNVDTTVSVIIRSYANSIGQTDFSISNLNYNLLEKCVLHAKTMETDYKRGYLLSSLKKFVKKTRSLATSLEIEGYNINKNIHNYRLGAGNRNSAVCFNFSEKQNVWAIKIEEFDKIKNAQLTDKSMLQTRDMFIVATLAGGLRISELYKINKDSIDKLNNKFVMTLQTEKTGAVLNYEIRKETVDILKKYNYNMKLLKNSQNYCEALKKLAKHVGLTRQVIQFIPDVSKDSIGRKTYFIWELFSSKCARKAFISILYNKGVPVDKIARITKHSSDSINHYISVLEEVDTKTINTI